MHANFQHECYTNGPLRACQSLQFTQDVPNKFGESSVGTSMPETQHFRFFTIPSGYLAREKSEKLNFPREKMMTSYLSPSFFPLCSRNIISSHKSLWKCPSYYTFQEANKLKVIKMSNINYI